MKPSEIDHGSKYCSLPSVEKENYFFEDFERMDSVTGLPQKWHRISTPGNADDNWKTGTLTFDAKSGSNCVYVEGGNFDQAHDTWLFSPPIYLSEQALYMDFYVHMPGIGDPDVKSRLEIYLCADQSPETIVKEFDSVECITDDWIFVVRPLGDYCEHQNYCLAFHCVSPSRANTLCIDNVHVSDGCHGEFYSEGSILMDTLRDVQAALRIFNNGASDLEVSLKSDSLVAVVESLPLKIAPRKDTLINLRIRENSPRNAGTYVTFRTNDPNREEVVLPFHSDPSHNN